MFVAAGTQPNTVLAREDAVAHGIGYLSEDRKRYGLALKMDVEANIVLASMRRFTGRLGRIKFGRTRVAAEEHVKSLVIKTPSLAQRARNLSGGNQQKVVMAKWLTADTEILIFDEPTRGIDVGAKSEIYRLLNDLAQQGKSIIMISSELPEILRMSHRILVMCEGRITGELNAADASQEAPTAATEVLKNEASAPVPAPAGCSFETVSDPVRGGVSTTEQRSDPLQTNIADAWERLNQWRSQLKQDAAAISEQQTSLSAREAQIEARDAAFRGQLHDITRFNEQLAEREKQLAERAAQVQVDADLLTSSQKEFLDKQMEAQKKEEELHRREQALNQRWSRMQSTVCPHCQKPIAFGSS